MPKVPEFKIISSGFSYIPNKNHKKFLLGLLFWMKLVLMICYRCADNKPHKVLYLDMYLMCSRSSETNNHLFLNCEVAWQSWNKLFSLFGISWVCPDTLDIFFSSRYGFFGHNKGERLSGKWQDLLFYGVYSWKGMLEFLNSNFSLWFWCGIRIIFVASLWLIFMGLIWLFCKAIGNLFWNFDGLLSM